jgi:putative MATE family efflux protein
MKPQGKGARLTDGPVGKSILSLMVPMMLGMMAIVTNSVAGAFFIAQVSTEQLAAISFTFPVSFIVGAVAMALGTGTSSVVSRLFGGGNRDEVRRVTGHAMMLGLACGAVVVALGLLTIDPVFRLLGADEATLPLIHRYMQVYYWGGIFLVVPMIANSVLRASGDAKRPALIMTTAAILNIIIDPVLIFGLFGFPRLELEGAALGGVLSNALTMVAAVFLIIRREKLVDFHALHLETLLDSWRRILHVGIPSLTSSLMAPLTTAFITSQMAGFGGQAVAGFGTASRIEGVTAMALMALSAGITPFAGQNFGAGKLERVRDGMNWAFRFALVYGLSIAAIMLVGGDVIANIFGLEGTARATALQHMHLVPFTYAALGCSMAVNGALNALGKPVAAMLVSLSRTLLVYAPLAFILAPIFGTLGIFIAAATANCVAGGIGVLQFRRAYREIQARQQAKAATAAAGPATGSPGTAAAGTA